MSHFAVKSPLACAFGATAILVSSCGQHNSDAAHFDQLQLITQQLTEVESAFHQMATWREIRNNDLQYTRGLDRHDETLINNSFWQDAAVSYGTLIDIDELAVWANDSHANYATHQHHVTGMSMDADGKVAHVESYVIFSSNLPRDKELETAGKATPGRVPRDSFATLGSGRYVDRYESRNDQWRMRIHEYLHEISMRLRAVDLCAVACIGRWDETDISYERPLKPLSQEDRRSRVIEGMHPHAPAN